MLKGPIVARSESGRSSVAVSYFGILFMIICVSLTSLVVLSFYAFLLPEYMARSSFWTCFHLVFGHWLLVNIVFNYYMGVRTHPGKPAELLSKRSAPGRPPAQQPVQQPAGAGSKQPAGAGSNKPTGAGSKQRLAPVCPRCIMAKPARAHHCFVCKCCVLKMDHHCPWLNNCVGHFNHRYFFLFTAFMFVGTIYVFMSASVVYCDLYRASMFRRLPFLPAYYVDYSNGNDGRFSHPIKTYFFSFYFYREYIDDLVSFTFLICFGVCWALGGLCFWHACLISRGETSIEWHINLRERSRLARIQRRFANPFDYGFRNNWRGFFGLTTKNGRTWWRHVLLPSTHPPLGDGVHWDDVRDEVVRRPADTFVV